MLPQAVAMHGSHEVQPESPEMLSASSFPDYTERVLSVQEKRTVGEEQVSMRAECTRMISVLPRLISFCHILAVADSLTECFPGSLAMACRKSIIRWLANPSNIASLCRR